MAPSNWLDGRTCGRAPVAALCGRERTWRGSQQTLQPAFLASPLSLLSQVFSSLEFQYSTELYHAPGPVDLADPVEDVTLGNNAL